MSLSVYCFYMVFSVFTGANIVVFSNIQTKYPFLNKKSPPEGRLFNATYLFYCTTKFFTSHVAAAEDVLVYLNAMVTVCPA